MTYHNERTGQWEDEADLVDDGTPKARGPTYSIEECIDWLASAAGYALELRITMGAAILRHLRAAQANEAFLRRIVKYVTEDRAVTHRATRLARVVEEVRQALGPLKEPMP